MYDVFLREDHRDLCQSFCPNDGCCNSVDGRDSASIEMENSLTVNHGIAAISINIIG